VRALALLGRKDAKDLVEGRQRTKEGVTEDQAEKIKAILEEGSRSSSSVLIRILPSACCFEAPYDQIGELRHNSRFPCRLIACCRGHRNPASCI
jgi:hypothetical protein